MGIIISTIIAGIILRALYASIKRSEYRQVIINNNYQAYLYAKDKDLPAELYKKLIRDVKMKNNETYLSLKQQQSYFNIPEIKDVDFSKFNPVTAAKKRRARKAKDTASDKDNSTVS